MNGIQDGHLFSIDLNVLDLEHQNHKIVGSDKVDKTNKVDKAKDTEFSFKEILCSSNVFEMGHKNHPQAPSHFVEIGHDYLISDVLITQNVWENVCGDYLSKKKENVSNMPIQRVNWFEVALFCNILSRMANLPSCYEFVQGTIFFDGSKKGYRMPFEIEWENSARANSSYEYSGSDIYSDVANLNTKDNYLNPIKMRKPNDWGIYDMTGNVNEWCNDIFDESSYYKRIKKGGISCFDVNEQHFELDIQNSKSTQMVVRGGSWFNTPSYSKVYTRHHQNALLPSAMVGVRVVRTV